MEDTDVDEPYEEESFNEQADGSLASSPPLTSSADFATDSNRTSPFDDNLNANDTDDEVIVRKRTRRVVFPSDHDEPQGSLTVAKAQWPRQDQSSALSTRKLKTAGNRDRPRASDCDPTMLPVVKTAIEIYRALLLTENPYPTAKQEGNWVKGAWTLACSEHGVSDMTLTAQISQLVSKLLSRSTKLTIHLALSTCHPPPWSVQNQSTWDCAECIRVGNQCRPDDRREEQGARAESSERCCVHIPCK